MDVENDSLTMKTYDPEKSRWFSEVAKRNLALFYERWTPSTEKDYLWLHRTRIGRRKAVGETVLAAPQRARRRYLAARRRWLNSHRAIEVAAGLKRRLRGAA